MGLVCKVWALGFDVPKDSPYIRVQCELNHLILMYPWGVLGAHTLRS